MCNPHAGSQSVRCPLTPSLSPASLFLTTALPLPQCPQSPLEATEDGELLPWEIAKAVAYQPVTEDVDGYPDAPPSELVGQRVDEYVASRLVLSGPDGGHAILRTLRKVLNQCQDPSWYPGKPARDASKGGRAPVYTDFRSRKSSATSNPSAQHVSSQ